MKMEILMFKKVLAGVAGLVSFGLTYAEVIPGTTLSIDFQAGQVQAGGRIVTLQSQRVGFRFLG
jgi:hypothetical protein